MKYFLDTEFIEDGKTIDLISIAIVAEDGQEFYVENLSANLAKANEWVKQNVIANLWRVQATDESRAQADNKRYTEWKAAGGNVVLRYKEDIKNDILKFIGEDNKIEFWGYFSDYDWVVFCQLFGTMLDLPKGFPMLCLDLKQALPNISQDESNHNALDDARWIKETYFEYLVK